MDQLQGQSKVSAVVSQLGKRENSKSPESSENDEQGASSKKTKTDNKQAAEVISLIAQESMRQSANLNVSPEEENNFEANANKIIDFSGKNSQKIKIFNGNLDYVSKAFGAGVWGGMTGSRLSDTVVLIAKT